MTLYSVHAPGAEAPDLADRADALAFVKEGFSWPALFVPALWLIYQRMWIELLVFVVLIVGLQAAFAWAGIDLGLVQWITLAVMLLFAIEANDLRRAALSRRGYRLAGIVTGRDREAAELSFFRSWLPQQERTMRNEEGRAAQPPVPLRQSGGDPEDVIGLFPGS